MKKERWLNDEGMLMKMIESGKFGAAGFRSACALAAAMVLNAANGAFAGVGVSAAAPAENLLSFSDAGTIASRIIDIDVNENHARGQLFSLTNSAAVQYEITAITFKHSGSQTFDGDALTLYLFQGSEAQWITGTGHVATNESFYNGTTVTPLYSESFVLDGTIDSDSGQYVTLELAEPVAVSGAGEYGFFLTYDRSSESNPDDVDYLEAADGGRISIGADAHYVSVRTMRYFVHGMVTPKTLILLGMSNTKFN
ncbi:hypothetical protein [Pontiella sp.]|uniref:hypothetical protein n=1 Tax=Pontiella sp. TaxID=2837462 RepID=UPI0035641038